MIERHKWTGTPLEVELIQTLLPLINISAFALTVNICSRQHLINPWLLQEEKSD